MSNYFTSLFGYLVRDKEAHEKIDNHNHNELYYPKDQMDNVILKNYSDKGHTHDEYESNAMDNQVEMNFSTIGTAQIVRRGKVVSIHGYINFQPSGSTTMSNNLTLPEWARPSEHCCLLNASSGVKVVHGANVIDMNQQCTGYLQVIQQSNSCAFIHMNKDNANGGHLYAELTYLVD